MSTPGRSSASFRTALLTVSGAFCAKADCGTIKALPARANATAKAYGGNFKLKVDFDALQEKPTFDMTAEFTNLNLVLLNDFLKAYGNFDVKKGKKNKIYQISNLKLFSLEE